MDDKKKLELNDEQLEEVSGGCEDHDPIIMLRRLHASAAVTSICRLARPAPAAAQARQNSSVGFKPVGRCRNERSIGHD